MTAEEIIRKLKLQPHPREEGFFLETYRCSDKIPCYDGERSHSTAIVFLLTAAGFSEMHRLRSDEIFHFYLGSPAEMLLLDSGGEGRVLRLGSDLTGGESPQIVVPRGTWQGMRTTGDLTLFGCTVSPGFDYSDYETGNRDELIRQYPAFADLIRQLTRAL